MADSVPLDYKYLDRPEILSILFHPRKQSALATVPPHCREIRIPVEKDIHIGGRFHMAENPQATLLFFHGNGEIAADYDDLGPIFTQTGVNFWVVDYRGYGQSDGTPTVAGMLKDSHLILEYALRQFYHNAVKSPMIVMGRSLGSASALELVQNHPNAIQGLIIESGFAYAGPLLRRLGASSERIDALEKDGFSNIAKISAFTKPTLIIHAQYDHIIPFSDGRALYNASPAAQKRLLQIPNANHNDIFARGFEDYLAAIATLVSQVRPSNRKGIEPS